MLPRSISRRSILAMAATARFACAAARRKPVPIGLALYSLKNEIQQDFTGTLRAVAQMGYDSVEFFTDYYAWTPARAREVRKLLDDLKIGCFSTQNSAGFFDEKSLPHAIEVNQILGSKFLIMGSPGRGANLDGWKTVAGTLNRAAVQCKQAGLHAGFHTHQEEWRLVEGRRPVDVLAAGTGKEIALQVDTATCMQAGGDPVAFTLANPGRLKTCHCRDYSSDPKLGDRVLIGEGNTAWKQLIDAAETQGGIECYVIEQEGSRFAPMETVKRCLDNLRRLRES